MTDNKVDPKEFPPGFEGDNEYIVSIWFKSKATDRSNWEHIHFIL